MENCDTDRRAFKICPLCKKEWKDIVEFVEDKELMVNGYQVSFDNVEEGHFLLTHMRKDCLTTFCIKTGLLRILYKGPDYKVRNMLCEGCKGLCLIEMDTEPCSAKCDMRWARDVIQILKSHQFPVQLKNKMKLC